jgi:hypothetical protein
MSAHPHTVVEARASPEHGLIAREVLDRAETDIPHAPPTSVIVTPTNPKSSNSTAADARSSEAESMIRRCSIAESRPCPGGPV